MPPRSGGSHSSHRSSGSSFRSSSSRSSSSRSSSSRSSFSSGPSRSSFSSGPSRHSSSSHRGSSGSGLFGSGRGPSASGRGPSGSSSGRGPSSVPTRQYQSKAPVRMNVPVNRRPRIHQPVRYNGIVRPMLYYCMNHDYIYYPEAWTDQSTGRRYEAGYYDESGQYYQNVVVNEDGKNKTTLKCEYCDTVVNLEWLEGATLACPNCGAPLDNTVSSIPKDQVQSATMSYEQAASENPEAYYTQTKKPSLLRRILPLLIGFFALSTIFNVSRAIIDSSNDGGYYDGGYDNGGYVSETDSIYVAEIGRECERQGEYYYDEPTDCYFQYYDDGEVQNWQYWYEGISSDFGDYGWMEWDNISDCWYIETGRETWEVLPARYESDRLWHIEEVWEDNTNMLYVKEIDRICEWQGEYYYDEPTDCYFLYYDDGEFQGWQYWYEGISSDYGDYGWMEWDEEENCWYIEEDDSSWIRLPDTYDSSELWHMEE